MSWLNDLTSAIGIPAGAAAMASAIYVGCSGAQKVARRQALHDIAEFLKNPAGMRSLNIGAIIQSIFNLTFGFYHLTIRCFVRSVIATILSCLTLYCIMTQALQIDFTTPGALIMLRMTNPAAIPDVITEMILGFFLFAILPDYIALAKTRLLLRQAARSSMSNVRMIHIVMIDCIASLAISITFSLSGILYFDEVGNNGYIAKAVLLDVMPWTPLVLHHFFWQPGDPNIVRHLETLFISIIEPWEDSSASFVLIFLLSTIFTSIWMFVVFISSIILKFVSPMQHFVTWFFDIDRNPLKAVGFVGAVLIVFGAGVWSAILTITHLL